MWTKLVLVVPCYNEAERFDAGRFEEALAARASLRLLLVDDGSSDGTADVLETFRAESQHAQRVAVLAQPENAGKAEAVRAGILHVANVFEDADFVGYWDADLATPFEALDDFASTLKRRPDARFLLGARVRLMGREIRRKPSRHVLGRVFATAASAVVRLPVYDTQCGAKIIERATAERIFADAFRTRWIFDVELLARFVQWRGRARAMSEIAEVPLSHWDDVDGSKVKGRDFLRAAVDLGRVYAENRQASGGDD